MDFDLQNAGPNPYVNNGYFVALGSAAPIHPKDYPSYTRLVWCIDGRAKGIAVGWFGGGKDFASRRQRGMRPCCYPNCSGPRWGARMQPIFSSFMAPL